MTILHQGWLKSSGFFSKNNRAVLLPGNYFVSIGSIKSGLIHGNAAMVDGMVERMTKEMGTPVRVLATGGLATLISGGLTYPV